MLSNFDAEEQLMLNNSALRKTKEEFLSHLDFCVNISADPDIVKLTKQLADKVSVLSPAQWMELQSSLPFDVDGAYTKANGDEPESEV